MVFAGFAGISSPRESGGVTPPLRTAGFPSRKEPPQIPEKADGICGICRGIFYHAFKTLNVETQNISPADQWRFAQAARKGEITAEGTKTRKGGAEVNIRIIKKPLEKQFNSNAGLLVGGLWVVDSIQPGVALFGY